MQTVYLKKSRYKEKLQTLDIKFLNHNTFNLCIFSRDDITRVFFSDFISDFNFLNPSFFSLFGQYRQELNGKELKGVLKFYL